MKVFAFLVALVFFVGSFLLFGYAFAVPSVEVLFIDSRAWLFGFGIIAVCLSLMIPFHLLEKFD